MTSPRAPRAPGRPLVLGHRGASGDAPENTLAAFRLAVAQGADGVELDVWRCATGELVVFHDEDATRISGAALVIPDAPLGEIRGLDAGAWKGPAFRGERVPLLAEVLDALPGAIVNVELKSRDGDDQRPAAALARLLAARADTARILVSSFDPRLLVAFRREAPGIAIGVLVEDTPPSRAGAAVALRALRPQAVHPDRVLATADRMRRWRRRGLAVNVWSVDDPAEAERLCRLGAAGLMTDFPARVRDAVRTATGA
jgi:glycerophosphoryl diester phosphodiesterase